MQGLSGGCTLHRRESAFFEWLTKFPPSLEHPMWNPFLQAGWAKKVLAIQFYFETIEHLKEFVAII